MMKRSGRLFVCVGGLMMMTACSITEISTYTRQVSVRAGLYQGGIVENTDMIRVPNLNTAGMNDVDAFTGATHTGMNLGIHVLQNLKYGGIETGADVMTNKQVFSYDDLNNGFTGTREFSLTQCSIPLTYSMELFKKRFPQAHFRMKAGYLAQWNIGAVKEKGILPDYIIHQFSGGALLGFSLDILTLPNGSKTGLFLYFYRGSRIYTDFYNQENFEMPGSAFIRYGISYQIQSKED
jgi:hypothetical protein